MKTKKIKKYKVKLNSILVGLMIVTMVLINTNNIINVSAIGLNIGDKKITLNDSGDVAVDETASTINSKEGAWNYIYGKCQKMIVGFSGVGTITMLLSFIYTFTCLAACGDNEKKRESTINRLIYCAIATACLGAVTIIAGFFFYIFQ